MVVAHDQTVQVPYALILVLRFIEVLLHSESMDTICEVDDSLRILSLTGGRSECKAMQISPKPTRPFPFIELTDFAGDKKQASLH
jgi:hypothetical protein